MKEKKRTPNLSLEDRRDGSNKKNPRQQTPLQKNSQNPHKNGYPTKEYHDNPVKNKNGNKRVILSYLLSDYCMWGTLGRASHVLTHLITKTMKQMLFVSSFYRGGDWGTERLSDLPMVAQMTKCDHRTSESVLSRRALWHLSYPWGWKIRESFMEDGALTLREKAEVRCLELGARHAFQLKGRTVFQMPALCDSLRSETTWSASFVWLDVAKTKAQRINE